MIQHRKAHLRKDLTYVCVSQNCIRCQMNSSNKGIRTIDIQKKILDLTQGTYGNDKFNSIIDLWIYHPKRTKID